MILWKSNEMGRGRHAYQRTTTFFPFQMDGSARKGSTTATPSGAKCLRLRDKIVSPRRCAVAAMMMAARPGAWPCLARDRRWHRRFGRSTHRKQGYGRRRDEGGFRATTPDPRFYARHPHAAISRCRPRFRPMSQPTKTARRNGRPSIPRAPTERVERAPRRK
jgi:hypothetical protein